MPQPSLDPELVAQLAALASELDGGAASSDQDRVDRFNALAGTDLSFSDFQGIYGAEEHETWVERLLTIRATTADPSLDRDGLVSLVQSVLDDPCDDARIAYVDTVVLETFGVRGFTDAVFWPQEFFGPELDHEPTAAEIADEVLRRRQGG